MKKIISTFILFFFSAAILYAQSAVVDSLKNLLKTARKDTTTLKILNSLSKEYKSLNDYESSKDYSRQAINLADKLTSQYSAIKKTDTAALNTDESVNRLKRAKAIAIHNIAAINYNQGNYDDALNNFFVRLKIAEELNDKNLVAESYNNIGLVYQALANYEEALKYSLAALKIKKETGDKTGIADCYSSIGNICMNEGNYPEALKEHLAALKLRDEINDKVGMEESYNNMGVLYTRQENYDEALKNYFASLKISKEIGEKWDIALCYQNIGSIYQERGDYDEALKNYLEGLKMSEEIADRSGMAQSYASIGSVYAKQGNYNEGLKNLLASLKIYDEIGEKRGAAEDGENIGEIYYDMGKYPEALLWLNKTLQAALAINHRDLLKETYLYLSKTYLKISDYKKSLEYHTLYSDLKDSLFNEAKSGQMAEMKTKYETEKKEKEIELLNKDKQLKESEIEKQKNLRNGILAGTVLLLLTSGIVLFFYKRRREAEMQYQIIDSRMKAMNAQLNQHFIFSSLSAIRSYMATNFEQANDYLVRFAKYVRAVLTHSDQQVISLKQELEELENYIVLEQFRFSNKFSYHIHIGTEINPEELSVPPLLFQPVVENSILHGFNGIEYEGLIEIDIRREDHRLICKISDNGKGLDKNNSPKKKERKSFGMKLTQERIDIFNVMHNQKALFHVNELEKGVMVTLTLPIK